MANKNYRIESNVRRVRASVADEQGRYKLRTRSLARAFSAAARDNVRANIKPRSQGGLFPGYAITGALAKKVVASEPEQTSRGWEARVRVLLTGKTGRYAGIHERGGTIPIKNPAQIRAMFANLRKHGQLTGGRGSGKPLKVIRIKRKQYFARGIDRTRREWSLRRLVEEFGKM